MIRIANQNDAYELKLLWKELYNDSDEYINHYFDRSFQNDLAFVMEIDKKIIGVMYLLPIEIYKDKKAFYWYAGGIKKEFRHSGLFNKLVEHIYSFAKSKGYYNICVPANGLSDFYKKKGFYFEYKKDSVYIEKSAFPLNAEICELKNDFFEKYLPMNGDAIWQDQKRQFVLDENKFYCGKNIDVIYESTHFPFYLSDEKLYSLITHEKTVLVAQYLLDHFGIDKAELVKIGQGNEMFALSDFPLYPNSKFYFPMI